MSTDKTVKLPHYISAAVEFFEVLHCREQACLFRFFRGELGHLRIRLSLVARPVSADETVKLPPYVSAVLSFAISRFGTAEKTVRASRDASAVLNFYAAPHWLHFQGEQAACCRGVKKLLTISY